MLSMFTTRSTRWSISRMLIIDSVTYGNYANPMPVAAYRAGPPSIGCRRCGTDLLIAIALLQQANVFEDIQRFFIGRARNFHVWRPASKLLIRCDAIGEDVFIDVGKIRFLRPGNLGGRRLVHVDPGLFVGAHECLRHIRFKPVTGRRKAGKTARSDPFANLSHNMSDAIGLQLLRERSLLLNIPPLAVTEGLVDFGGAAGADRFYLVEVDACLVAGVFEHGVRLAALEHDDFGAFQLVPREGGIRLSSSEEEPVHLVDLGKMDCSRRLPLIE